MSAKLNRLSRGIINLVLSPRFFYAVVIILAIQALWIALTARYPQAFDENYHFGLIQLHAQQWLPFFTYQPEGASIHGAIVRDPSYLFQYLLSFPYRFLDLFGASETLQVIVLRLINIAMFVAGLFVYRKLFDELNISTQLRNVTMLIFVLLPVVPLLAGQINYDNLVLILTGLMFLYMVRFVRHLRSRRLSEPLVPLTLTLQILLVGGLGSIVKFAFAPIFLATMIAMAVTVVFYFRLSRYKPKLFQLPLDVSKRAGLIVLAVFTIITIGLCLERYGVNLVQYGSPVPKCDKVLSIEECQNYSPWARDYLFAQTYPRPTVQGYLVYPFVWFNRMVFETMFTITSYWNDAGTVTYDARSPLRIGHIAAWIGLGVGMIGAVIFRRRIRMNRGLTVLLGITVFYTIVLFLQNLAMYKHSGEAVAIHGRYLIPVFPILIVCLVMGWQSILRYLNRGKYNALILVVLTLLFMQGGGITAWIVRSDNAWYWQNNTAASNANAAVKSVLDKVIYH